MLQSQLVSTQIGENENVQIVLHRKTDNTKTKNSIRQIQSLNNKLLIIHVIIIPITLLDAFCKHILMFSSPVLSHYYLLILGDVCMAILLMYCFSNTVDTNLVCKGVTRLLLILISLILSPISAFIIYELRRNSCCKFLQKYVKPPNFHFNVHDGHYRSRNLYRSLKLARYRHQGLLIQTIFSFFTAIIQWYTMSQSNTTEYYISIAITGIMILICSFIYQLRNTLFTQSFCFNVLITIYDVVSTCVMISIVGEYMWYYVYSVIACAPFITMSVIEIILTAPRNNSTSMHLIFAPVWFLVGSIASSLVCFSFFMTSIDRLFQSRFQYDQNNKYTEYDTIFWSTMRGFLSQSTNDQDRRHRICCINMELFKFQNYGKKQCELIFMNWSADSNIDSEFKLFLEQKEQQLYQSIDTYPKLRMNISKHPLFQIFFPLFPKIMSFMVKEFKEIVANWVLMIFLVLLIPSTIGLLFVMLLSSIYSVSRVVVICFQFIALGFSKHLIFLVVWLLFSLVVLIVFTNEMKIYRYFNNILPLAKIPSIENKKTMKIHIRRVYCRYNELAMIPEREQIIIGFFGNDVGSIINELIGRFTQL